MKMLQWLALSLILALGATSCFGQAAAMNGQIVGTITDPAGSVVPNATVKAVNTGTGFSQSTTTTSSGLYRFNILPLGLYGSRSIRPASPPSSAPASNSTPASR